MDHRKDNAPRVPSEDPALRLPYHELIRLDVAAPLELSYKRGGHQSVRAPGHSTIKMEERGCTCRCTLSG